MGMRRPVPKARGVTLKIEAACRRLNSALPTMSSRRRVMLFPSSRNRRTCGQRSHTKKGSAYRRILVDQLEDELLGGAAGVLAGR